MMLLITIFILLCGYTTAQFPYFGKCPSPDVQPDFDMKRFMGTWYEIQRTMSFLQLGSRCTSTNYSDSGYDDGSYEVINEGRAPILKWKKSVRLIATVPDKNEPAKMQLRLSDYFQQHQCPSLQETNESANTFNKNYTFSASQMKRETTDCGQESIYALKVSVHGNYWILATDYDNYAIIWSCNHIWLTLQYARTENLWVYSRKRSFTDEIQEEVNRKLEAIKHIKVKKLLKKVSQKDCDEDDGTTPSPDDNETE